MVDYLCHCCLKISSPEIRGHALTLKKIQVRGQLEKYEHLNLCVLYFFLHVTNS